MANSDKEEYIRLLEEKLKKQVQMNQEMLATIKEQENEILYLQATINRIKQSAFEVSETIEKLQIQPDQFNADNKVCFKVNRIRK